MDWSSVATDVHSVPERLSAELELMIVRGQLAPDQRLPPERELAAELGVSRASLREALRELEIKGLLDRRPGRGTIVTAEGVRNTHSGDLLSPSPAAGDFQQVMDLRATVEPSMAQRAAERAEAADIENMTALLEAASAPTSAKDYLALDMAFHIAVAEATHNPLLVRLLGTVNQWASSSRRLGLQGAARRRLSLEAHHRIFAAIKAGQADSARREMAAHLDAVYSLVAGELDGGVVSSSPTS